MISKWIEFYSRGPLVINDVAVRNTGNSGDRSEIVISNDDRSIDLIVGDFLQYLQKRRYFRKNTLFFLDPPYPLNTRSSNHRYKYDFTDDDHELLLSLILKSPAKVLLCSYTNPTYDFYLAGWNKISYKSKTRKGMRVETAYLNYEPPNRLQDYSFTGGDYRERERIKRKISREVSKLHALPVLERNAIIDKINKTFNNQQTKTEVKQWK